MGKGIDYGLGQSNIDRATGIRYGVINMNALAHWAWESFEADYGPPTCGECRTEAAEYDKEKHGEYEQGRGCADYACETCRRVFDSSEAYTDEPLSHGLDDGEYQAVVDSINDAFVLKSPYYTRAAFCSPCAPGACHLEDTDGGGERAYCFGHDWFEGGVAPYPVCRVGTDELVAPEVK